MSHLHNALQKWFDPRSKNTSEKVRVEYRLLCSGELYNLSACCPPYYIDYWRSPFLRLILDGLPGLFVTNEPHRNYPQELSFTFDCHLIEDSSDESSTIYHNDQEIAEEFVALLSVLTRRLVCLLCKVSEYYYDKEMMHGLPQHWPYQVYNIATPRIWSVKPATVIYDGQDRPKIECNMPPPVAVDTAKLMQFLKAFALLDKKVAENFISAARLYKTALTFIEDEPEIAYLHLIFSIETTANFAYRSFSPDETKQLETKRTVKELAQEYGLSEAQAKELTLEACKGIPWVKDKFVKFIVENTDNSIFTEEDSLFKFPLSMGPSKENFVESLDEIYRMRSKAGHTGEPFPPQVGVGTKPTVPIQAMTQWYRDFKKTGAGFIVPPAVWFERVANLALLTYGGRLTNVRDTVVAHNAR